MKLKNIKIAFLGDSITEGAGATSKEKCYVSKVAELTGATCLNYGIGGTRIAYQTTPSEYPRYDMDFCSRVGDMETDIQVIAVFGGTNDFSNGDAPIGKFTDRTNKTFYGALHTLYTSLIEKYPESLIVVITPLHRLMEEKVKNGVNVSIKDYVDAIRKVAEYYSLPVIDLFSQSGIQPNIPIIKEKYMRDGLHPTDAGHEVIAKKIAAFLKTYII